MRRKICIVTGSRAEYGLLFWLIQEVQDDPDLELLLVVTGSHLSKKHGFSIREIQKDGFKISGKVNLHLKDDSSAGAAAATGRGVVGFSKLFSSLKPDIVVLLGDRYEILAAAASALLLKTCIAHIHGGEVTRGAYDDSIRHAITKMSYLHFTCHADYARRVIQMGEAPERVFNYGAPALDGIKKLHLLSKNELEKSLDFKLDKATSVVTFHPLTMEQSTSGKHIRNLLIALSRTDLKLIFTLPNADPDNDAIFNEVAGFVKANSSISKCYANLGQLKYLSLLKHADLMVGNSSSGIFEAPSFKLPVVNIGNRQTGRIKPKNVIDCGEDPASIIEAINKARSDEFRSSLKELRNPFGEGNASPRIKEELKRADLSSLAKGFFDLDKAGRAECLPRSDK